MKKSFLLFFIFSIFSFLIYSQPADQIIKDNIPFINGNEGIISPQCIGGLVYDDNTFETGYGWNAGRGIGKFVMSLTPSSYPFTINQVCVALTRNSSGTANFIFDIVVYDQTGPGGGPGNLLAAIPNQTAVNLPIWPTVAWFDFTNLTGIPAITTGSVFVGISWNPETMVGHYIAADESATTTQRPGWGYILSAWAPITNYFPYYKALGVRADGTTQTYAHNIGVGPFLSLPGAFNQRTTVIKAKVSNLGTSNETGIPISFVVNGTQVSTITLNLNAGAVDSVSFNWIPADTGAQVLKVISSLATDQYRANDTVTAAGYVNPTLCADGLIYDDNTFEGGCGWISGYYQIYKWVMLFTPQSYPYTINQLCFAMSKNLSGAADWTFDIEVYDTTGPGGSPGNLLATVPNQTAVGVQPWPTVTWYSFTGITSIPAITSGSVYVGISYNNTYYTWHLIAEDQSTTTPLRTGYFYSSTVSTWTPIQSTVFSGYRALGMRANGIQTYAHNIAVGPFLSLPEYFNSGVQKTIKAKISNFGTSNETGIPISFIVNGTQVSTLTMNLNAGAADSVSFNWTPTDTGTKILKIISSLASDQYRADDTVTTTVHVIPAGIYQVCWGPGVTPAAYPFETQYMDARTQMIYTAAQIGLSTGATIQKIGFNVSAAYPVAMNNFSIKMQNTTYSLIYTFIQSGWTEVYNGTYSIPGTGWQFITLATPFTYTGANLLIEICYNNSSNSSSSTVISTPVGEQICHQHSDLPNGNGCTDLTAGSVQVNLPNICFQTNMVGMKKINNNIPDKFSLLQNYPNPFNPKTNINYQLPIDNYVKLTIFDALGREAAVLVNEKQSAGNYSVEWDGTNYSSGLYFYKLETENFVESKKMVLIK